MPFIVAVYAVISCMPADSGRAADAAAGNAAFAQCAACHAADDHTNRIGPHLGGVVGQKAASVEGSADGIAVLDPDREWMSPGERVTVQPVGNA